MSEEKEKKLVKNRWSTPDGTVLESKTRHDFVCHLDKNGKRYCIDGGIDYIKISGDIDDLTNLCEYE